MAGGVGGGLEGLDADAAHGVDEVLVLLAAGAAGGLGRQRLALVAVGGQQCLDHAGHLGRAEGRPDDLAGHGRARQVGAVGAAERDLVPLPAVLVHAQDADVAAVVVAAGVDAAADVQVDLAQVPQLVQVLVALGDGFGDGQRARVGERAEVAAGAGDHVGQQADVGLGQAQRARFLVEGGQLVGTHPGQQQVLLVRHAGLAAGVAVGEVGGRVHLVGRGVTGRVADALERQHHGAQQRVAVRQHVAREPAAEALVAFGGCAQQRQRLALGVRAAQVGHGVVEAGGHAVVLGLRDGVGPALHLDDLAEFLFHLVHVGLALGLHEDLDARLPEVVAAAVAVVDADHRLQVVHELVPGQELAHHRADDRRAAHAAAHAHLEAQLAGLVLHELQAHVVPAERGAVFAGAVERHLELARQEGELGVQRAPLAQDFGEGPRIGDLVGGDAGQRVAGDVADAVAAGLDAVHVHGGQQVHHVGALVQRDPVVLHVRARGEVAVAVLQARADAAAVGERDVAELFLRGLGLGQQRRLGNVVFAGDAGQHAQLAAGELAVGHGHAQHGGVALHVPAVLQAQRLELVAGELAGLEAVQLIAVLVRTQADELLVEFCVLVHGGVVRLAGALRSEPVWRPPRRAARKGPSG